MDDLTKRQSEILDYILAYRRKHGFSPALREICEAFDIHSTNGVVYHLERLEANGAISWNRATARGVVPTRTTIALLDMETLRLTSAD